MPNTRTTRVWDIVLSIVFILVLLAATVAALMVAIFLPMAADGCGDGCTMVQIQIGFILALAVPVVCALIAIVVTIMFMVKRRAAFWVPLAGVGGVILGLLLGSALVMTAIPGFF